jgi:RimJ/RimL family protein N-acetyltransferase
MNEYLALPLTLTPMPKVSYILDRLSEHDSWWTDFDAGRRERAAAILTNPNNVLFEVWKKGESSPDAQPVGLVMFSSIMPNVDCQFHPISFDGKLSNALGKRNLLLSLMAWAFLNLGVERISAEVPEFAVALIRYARVKLGFRFEAEGRTITRWTRASRRRAEMVTQVPDAASAALGSRKYRIVRYHGEWKDMILLSVTRDEFAAFISGAPAEESPDGIQGPTRPAASRSAGPHGVPSGNGADVRRGPDPDLDGLDGEQDEGDPHAPGGRGLAPSP